MIEIPDPPFDDITADEIRARMFENMRSGLDVSEGSLAYSFLAPVSIELAQMYSNLDQLVFIGSIQTTYGQFLDARAEEHGLERRQATRAVLTMEFSGESGTVIPAGTQVATSVAVQAIEQTVTFATEDAGVIPPDGDIELAAIAVDPGEAGNVPVGSVTRIIGFVPGVSAVTNVTAGTGGGDDETDEQLRERIIQELQGFAGAGTADDYRRWAQEVDGVGSAFVEPLWDGAGTVLVQVVDVDRNPANATLLDAVAVYIEERRPIGADVTVQAPTLLNVDVAATLTLEEGVAWADIDSAVIAAVDEYFEELIPGDDVVLTEVGAAIVTSPGVADYTGLQLNGAATNAVVAFDEMAVRNNLSLSVA